MSTFALKNSRVDLLNSSRFYCIILSGLKIIRLVLLCVTLLYIFSKQYVGKAEGTLREANSEHRYDIDQQGTLIGRHFASVCGYDNWSLVIIDKCAPSELARRHKFWLEELVTKFPVGLNESQGASYKQVIQSL